MRKVLSSVLVGVTSLALLSTTVIAASAATTTAKSTCSAIDAPESMNDMPASADCPTPGSGLHANVTPAVTPVTATSPISSTPLAFDRTNGDILAITKISGTNDIAFGGNFTLVYTPDAVSHAAVNFAVVDETSGAIIYAGNPSNSVTPSDNYVRAIASLNGVIYVGGDFDGWDGVASTHVAMLSPTGNPAPAAWGVTASWHPAPGGNIRAIAVDSSAVYVGGDSGVATAFNPTTGATIWQKFTTGGSIHAMMLDQGALFVGGLFETYDGYAQHGLVKVSLADGSVITAFQSDLRPDSGVGAHGAYDGEDTLALAFAPNSTTQILVGVGGNAPAGDSSNEIILFNITTGQRLWKYSTKGDSQAVGTVGDTAVSGYHNNTAADQNNPLAANYFAIQVEGNNGTPTTWDPQINGNQDNLDGGNNGVQAMYVDPVNDILFLAGAFEHWNGTTGLTHASLIAFSFTPSTATAPGSPTAVTAVAGNGNANVSWTAPVSTGGSPITSYTVKSSPGGFTATAPTATPVTVSGLTNGTAYTFTVTATNLVGTSAPSTASAPVTPASGGGSSNTAEGGTAGTSVTAANSGGGSGNAFSVVSKGAGATLVYSTSADAHGVLGYALTGASGTATTMAWTGYNATSMAARFYYNPGPTMPSAALRLADIRNASATAARVMLTASNQLTIQNNAGTTVTTFPDALHANTWYRIEVAISVSSTVATIKAAYYPFDSTTPVDPAFSTTTGNTGTANLTQVALGSAASSTWTGTSYFDDLAVQPSSTSFIGVFAAAGSTAPGAPTGVTATAGNGQATVGWTAPASNGGSAITGYTVTSSPGGFTATTAGPTSAIVTGLTNGTTYTFTVTATNAIGTGPASPASPSVTPATVPGAPTSVNAVPGDGQAAVSWTAPASNGGSAITGYTVTSSPGGLTASTAGTTSAAVMGLTNGTAYTFTVTAANAIGTGAASVASSPVTPVGSGSGKSNSAEGGTAGTSLTAASSGGASGTAFNLVTKGAGAALVFSTAARAHGALGYALTGASGTATSVSWNGYSATSMALRFYYNPGPTLPNAVIRLADIRNASGTAARVELSAANQIFIQNNAGATVTTFAHALQANTWYRVELAISVSSSAATINAAYYLLDSTSPVDPAYATTAGNTGTANLTQVSVGSAASATWTGTSYFDDLAAQSPSATFIGPVSGSPTVPGAPNAVSAVPGDGQATVSWSAPSSNGGSAITSYTVTSSPGSFTASTSGTSVPVTGLTDGTSYTFTVTATNGIGTGPASAPSSPVTPVAGATVPGAPTGVNATPGDGQASVSWTAPASDGGASITGYKVTSSPGGFTGNSVGAATSAVVSGLTDGTSYTFTVTATNSVGTGPASGPSPAVIPVSGATVPDAPTAVSAVPGDGQATVSWSPPASDGGAAITSYKVTSSPGGFTATNATSPVTVTGLTDGTSYTFTVTATNSVGTGPASAPSPAVIPTASATVPGAPTNVSAVPGNTQATVSWTAPASDGGSAITGYTVTSSPGNITATTAGATSAAVITLTNGTTYTFTVTATNGAGTGPASTASNVATPTAGTFVSNSAEGGTSGTSVTTANSGGASGNALTLVSKGTGAALVFASAAADHGSLGYSLTGASGTATLMGWNGYSAPSIALRFYYNPGPSLPNAVIRLADVRNASATAARVELSASNQIFIQNTAGTTVTTFPHALAVNTWYRVELTISVSASTATIKAAYYLGNSTTPVDPAFSSTTGNTGTANITQVSIGSSASATWTGTSYFDDLAAESLSTAFIGP